jgi:hypothetical protein
MALGDAQLREATSRESQFSREANFMGLALPAMRDTLRPGESPKASVTF